jgi:hypothetical protein
MHPTPPTSPTVCPFNIAKQNISILYHITRSTFPLEDAKRKTWNNDLSFKQYVAYTSL